MANISQMPDPFVVKKDLTNGIATNGDDARFSLGGLTLPSETALYGFASGIYPATNVNSVITDCMVSPNSTPNMTSIVNFGNYVIARANHGPYWGAVTAPVTATHATASSSNPRVDIVAIRSRDGDVDASPTQSAQIVVIQGNPAATPSAPTSSLTDGDLVLAYVTVRKSTTTIIGTDIADQRRFVTASGGIVPTPTLNAGIAGAYEGQYRDNLTSNALERYDPTTGWVAVATPAQWSTFTPSLYWGGDGSTPGANVCNLGTGATAYCRYMITGKRLDINYVFNWGTAPYYLGINAVTTTLPPGIRHRNFNGESHIFAKLYVNDSVSGAKGNYLGDAFMRQNSSTVWLEFPNSRKDNVQGYYTVAKTNGVPGTGIPLINAANGDSGNGFPQGGILTITGTIEIA